MSLEPQFEPPPSSAMAAGKKPGSFTSAKPLSRQARTMAARQTATRSLQDVPPIRGGQQWDHLLLEKPRECMYHNSRESRPPLQVDLDTPTPCTYSVQQLPGRCHGTKINPRSKYSRGLLPNQNSQLWTQNVSWITKTPTPVSYTIPQVFGDCYVISKAPAYSMTPRRSTAEDKSVLQARKLPGPASYDSITAASYIMTQPPSFSITTKRTRTNSVPTPGPAHYFPHHHLIQHHSPAFSMRSPWKHKTKTL